MSDNIQPEITPQPPVNQSPGWAAMPPPENHLIWAILATVLCCLPTGIPAIVYASQVQTRWFGGDHEGARQSAEKAKFWNFISLGVGLVFYAGFVMLGALSAIVG